MNKTKGFLNLNRFKSSRAVKRLGKAIYDRRRKGGKKGGIRKWAGST